MAKLQVYKFVNPGNSGKENPATSAARTQTLALNRIGGTVSSIGRVISDIEKISIESIKDDKKREQFERRRERRQKDQSAEDSQEMVKAGKDKGLQKKVGKKLKGSGLFGFLEDFLKPIGSLLMKIGAFALTTELLKYLGDPENVEKISEFFRKGKFVFDKLKEFGENIANAIGDGLDFIFGKETTFEERLKAFGTIAAAIGGIGGIIAAAQGVSDLLDLGETADDLTPDDKRPKKPTKPTRTNPSGADPDSIGKGGRPPANTVKSQYGDAAEAAYKKILKERGDDAARVFLNELQESGGSVSKAQRRFNRYLKKGRFPKIEPPKPNALQRLGGFFGGLRDSAVKQGTRFRNFAVDQGGRLIKSLQGLPDWAARQYNNLSDAARKKWDDVSKVGQMLAEKGKGWASAAGNKLKAAGNWIADGGKAAFNKLASGAKNYFIEKVLDPIKPIIRPIAKKAAGIGQGMFDMLMKIPGANKIGEVLKKKGIGSMGDIATAGSKLGKRAAAILPVIGGIVNLAFAYDRAANGDSIGALIEGTSGILDIAGLATGGAGNVASMLLDGYMFARDFIPQLQQGEEAVVDAVGARGLKTNIDNLLKKLPNIGEIINMFMGKSSEGDIDSPDGEGDQELFLGGVVKNIGKGIGKAVGGIGKTVGNIASNPLVQTAASFIPGAAPIMAGVNMATNLMQGNFNPMGMLSSAAGMIPGMSGMMGNIGNMINGVLNSSLGNIGMNLLSGNLMGAATTGLGMLNPAVGQLAGSILSGGLNPMGMVNSVANHFGMGGIMQSMIGGNSMQMGSTIAKELGVDPKIVGGVERVTNKALKEGGMSAEYAMQTALEFVPIPMVLDRIVPMQVAVPINTGGGVVTAAPSSLTQRQ
ncbi:hypothetical protein SBM1_00142 [Synechococcus phage S-BM1]|nr:hypothetical protein SBM1_00142 [Synechococcus phage S-BM1]